MEGGKVSFIDAPAFGVDEMEKAIEYLKKEGYVRIANVLNSDEVKESTNLFWKFMTNLGTGIKRDDLKTWINDNWPNTFSNGIIDQYGIGQSEFLWSLRAHENVRKVFAGIWDTDELLTSFDGCNAFRPTHPAVCTNGKGKSWRTKGSWYHIDQGAPLKGFQCVQGFVTLTDVTEVSGGLVVEPKSHLLHETMLSTIPRLKKNINWVFIPKKMRDKVAANPVVIKAKAGDMMLWDSRTVHCNTPGEKLSPASHKDLIRLVAYVCMLPASRATKEVIENRVNGMKEGVSTSHWPCYYEPKKPGRWTREHQGLKPISMENWVLPELNEVQKRLAGILPYEKQGKRIAEAKEDDLAKRLKGKETME